MADEEGRLSFVAGMDDSDFVRGANNIRETIHETARDVKQTGMTIDEFTAQMNKLLGAFDKMTAAVNKNTQAHEQTALAGKKAGEEEKRGADKATEAIEKTTDATKDLGEEFEKSSGIMAEGMDKLTKYAAGFLTLQAGKDFIQKVTSIRGEFQKLEVNGEGESPLFAYLKEKQGFQGFDPAHPYTEMLTKALKENFPSYLEGDSIKWNFTKFLVDREGNVVARFEPTTAMSEVEAGVAACLKTAP